MALVFASKKHYVYIRFSIKILHSILAAENFTLIYTAKTFASVYAAENVVHAYTA